jgi:hypothetical protein
VGSLRPYPGDHQQPLQRQCPNTNDRQQKEANSEFLVGSCYQVSLFFFSVPHAEHLLIFFIVTG